MIYRFTNATGRQNYGVIRECTAGGAYVLMDTFEPKPGVTLPARFCFVSFEPNPFVTAQTLGEVLPVETPVQWYTPLIADAHKATREGQGAQWFADNAAIVGELIKAHR